jgi:hypothetical protein
LAVALTQQKRTKLQGVGIHGAKQTENFTTKVLARWSRNQNSEYLPQRRKGRKEINLPDLAFLASWREQFQVFMRSGSRKNLRKPQKL